MSVATTMAPWMTWEMDDEWLQENVKWHDFGNGSRLGKLARKGSSGIVLYHVRADATEAAFMAHTHTGGEAYFVLRGEVYDDDGSYPKGSVVWMPPGSRHTPKTRGDALILVIWPDGVEG